MAYTVVRRYKVEASNVAEIVRRVEQGFIPLISQAPGFIGYRVVRADNGDLATTSTFETRAQSEESVRTAAGWVRENLGSLLPNPPEVIGGEVRIRQVKPGVEPHFGVMRRYRSVKNFEEAARRVEEGLVPLLTRLPGFVSYVVLDPGDGGVISLSAFQDRDAAERSSQEVRGWLQQNLGDLIIDPPQVTTGEMLAGKTAS